MFSGILIGPWDLKGCLKGLKVLRLLVRSDGFKVFYGGFSKVGPRESRASGLNTNAPNLDRKA